VLEALQGGENVEKLYVLRSATGPEISDLKRAASNRNIPIALVPAEKLQQLTRVPHQGVVAVGGVLQYLELQDAIDHVVAKGDTPLFLLLDGVTDVRNIGAIARSALCLGAQALVLPTSHGATLTEEAVKTSAGALRQMLLVRVSTTARAMTVLKLNGISVLGTQMRGSIPLPEADFSGPACVVMGEEGGGVSKEVLKDADALIRIPMSGTFDSLNVSVAASIILYEAQRQRMTSSNR
jgi:23S rRNA (guanosine2251-2'-O)-methyltransferase